MAISPSGWASFCRAVGEIQIGKGIFSPRIVVEISIDDTSRSTWGLNLNLNKLEKTKIVFYSIGKIKNWQHIFHTLTYKYKQTDTSVYDKIAVWISTSTESYNN